MRKTSKFLIFVVLLVVSFICNLNTSYAASVEIKVNPQRPIKNENFSLIFTISTNSDETPYISFDPGSAEVQGRTNRGVSEQITIINGKIARKREVTFVYDLITERAGTLFIKDIVIDVDGEQIKHKNLRISILSKRLTPAMMFLEVEPSKKDVYVGEGFDINYYLYSRVNIMGSEIQVFPKLKNFSKRFRMVRANATVVERNGIMYKRSLKYSARVFAEKMGKTVIDPLHLRVQYASSRGGRSSFGLFGSVFSTPKIKKLRSKKMILHVSPLPATDVPKSFTGLVGVHTFKLAVPRNKFLVNEAVEAKFEVEGVGALENYSAPHLFHNDDLESFDIKSELIDITEIKKKKIFDYTYLARGPFLIEAQSVEFSYFDPDQKKYVVNIVAVPALRVSGKAIPSTSSSNVYTKVIAKRSESVKKSVMAGNLLVPVFNTKLQNSPDRLLGYINIALGVMVIVLFMFSFGGIRRNALRKEIKIACGDIKKNGVTYSRLFKLLSFLGEDKSELTLNDLLLGSRLPAKTKGYFQKLVETSESASYKSAGRVKPKYDSKHFEILKKYLQHDENNKRA